MIRHKLVRLAPPAALAALVACGGAERAPRVETGDLAPGVREQVEEALEASRRSPDDATVHGRLGMVLHAYELHEAAAEAYGRAAALEPGTFRWAYYRGRALAAAGHREEALAQLLTAIEIGGAYPPARVAVGDLLLDRGDARGAVEHYGAAARLDPDSPAAWLGVAKARRALGDAEAAVAAYEAALRAAPSSPAAHHGLGMLYRDQGRAAAAEHLARARQLKDATVAARDPLMAEIAALDRSAAGLTRRALQLARAGRTDRAIAVLLEAAARDPEFLPARVHLVELLAMSGRYEESEAHYRAAMAVNPNAQLVRLNHARSLIRQQRLEEARAELERVVAINPNLADARVLLGSMLEDGGSGEEAVAHYRAALRAEPSHPQANLLMARYLLRTGQAEEADEHGRRLLESEDESVPILAYRLGLVYAEAGARARAAEVLGQARRLAETAGRRRLVEEIDRKLEELG